MIITTKERHDLPALFTLPGKLFRNTQRPLHALRETIMKHYAIEILRSGVLIVILVAISWVLMFLFPWMLPN